MQVGKAIGALVAQGVLDLKQMAEHVLKAESEEDPERGQDEDTGTSKHVAHPPVQAAACRVSSLDL